MNVRRLVLVRSAYRAEMQQALLAYNLKTHAINSGAMLGSSIQNLQRPRQTRYNKMLRSPSVRVYAYICVQRSRPAKSRLRNIRTPLLKDVTRSSSSMINWPRRRETQSSFRDKSRCSRPAKWYPRNITLKLPMR